VSWVEFEVATFEFGIDGLDEPPAIERDLKPFEFETVTVNDRGEIVATEVHIAFYFEEPLGDGVAPLKLVAIPSGEFMMGSPEDEHGRYSDESPQHLVTVQAFFMGQTPVTQAQWRAVAALPKREHNLDPTPSTFKGDDLPVEQVTWYEAVEFCSRLSEHTGRTYRLPTEAEWEYACRADTTTPFYFGETITTELANYKSSVYLNEPVGKSRGETTSVGQFPPNSFGLYDMHGNVREWCQDNWPDTSNYKGAPVDGSAWLSKGERKVLRIRRGGSWSLDPRLCRSAFRFLNDPGDHSYAIGFVSSARPVGAKLLEEWTLSIPFLSFPLSQRTRRSRSIFLKKR
jgi:formylglycine-generating enzyme required for sulfatase activity